MYVNDHTIRMSGDFPWLETPYIFSLTLAIVPQLDKITCRDSRLRANTSSNSLAFSIAITFCSEPSH
jgi:hypothetical protein